MRNYSNNQIFHLNMKRYRSGVFEKKYSPVRKFSNFASSMSRDNNTGALNFPEASDVRTQQSLTIHFARKNMILRMKSDVVKGILKYRRGKSWRDVIIFSSLLENAGALYIYIFR